MERTCGTLARHNRNTFWLCQATKTSHEVRYVVDCTVFASFRLTAKCLLTPLVAHGGVATPWNGTTIPRRCVLPYTPKKSHTPQRPTAISRIISAIPYLLAGPAACADGPYAALRHAA